jgi:hypothetical protein
MNEALAAGNKLGMMIEKNDEATTSCDTNNLLQMSDNVMDLSTPWIAYTNPKSL